MSRNNGIAWSTLLPASVITGFSVSCNHALSPLMLLAPIQGLKPIEEEESGNSREYPLLFVGEKGVVFLTDTLRISEGGGLWESTGKARLSI